MCVEWDSKEDFIYRCQLADRGDQKEQEEEGYQLVCQESLQDTRCTKEFYYEEEGEETKDSQEDTTLETTTTLETDTEPTLETTITKTSPGITQWKL